MKIMMNINKTFDIVGLISPKDVPELRKGDPEDADHCVGQYSLEILAY